MSDRVLFVDDEPNVLEAMQRGLRKQVDMQTAPGGAEGLRLLRDSGPFGLVISDMRMPLMNGAQFLASVREQFPDTVRMILSGQADMPATIAAVNEGHIYRFLSKPCPTDQLLAAVTDGLRQHHLMTAEKVLLEQTLSGAVRMLIEMLGMVSPAASNRASRLQAYTLTLSSALGLTEHWQCALAAHVSQIGCVALPQGLVAKIEAHQALTEDEQRLYDSHPVVAGKLLAAIPRLEDVAAIVTGQFDTIDIKGLPGDLRQWGVRSIGRLLLKTSLDFDRLAMQGMGRDAAVDTLRAPRYALPGCVLQALATLPSTRHTQVPRQVRVRDLLPGMILDEDLVSPRGIRLVPSGHVVTRSLIVRLSSFADGIGVSEPFRALVNV